MNAPMDRGNDLDRLLTDPASEDAEVAAFLRTLQRRLSTPPGEQHRDEHLTAIRAAVRTRHPEPEQLSLPQRARAIAGMTAAKVALAATVAAAATGGAVTGNLPGPAQEVAAGIAQAVGLQLPHQDTQGRSGADPAQPTGDEPPLDTGQARNPDTPPDGAGSPGSRPHQDTGAPALGDLDRAPGDLGRDGAAPGGSQTAPAAGQDGDAGPDGAPGPGRAPAARPGGEAGPGPEVGRRPAAPGNSAGGAGASQQDGLPPAADPTGSDGFGPGEPAPDQAETGQQNAQDRAGGSSGGPAAE